MDEARGKPRMRNPGRQVKRVFQGGGHGLQCQMLLLGQVRIDLWI